MGLDWIVIDNNSKYKGDTYYRGKGLAWVLEEYNLIKSAKYCYGEQEGENSFLSKEQMNCILVDCNLMLNEQKFSSDLLDVIDKDELLRNLNEAKEILEQVLTLDNVKILCDY